MGLALVLAYVALNLLSPGDVFPAIAPLRPLLILAVISVPATLISRLSSPEIGKLRVQLALVVLFFGFASCSYFPHGGLRANLTTFILMAPNVMAYFMGLVQLRSLSRLSMMRATLVLVAIFVILCSVWETGYALSIGDSTPYVLVGRELNQFVGRIRGLGVLNDPNTFGQYLLILIPMLFVSRNEGGRGLSNLVVWPITLLFVWGVYLTGSRGTMLGIVVLAGLFFSRRFKTAGAVITAGFGSIVLLAVNATRSREISMSGGMDRLTIWSDGMSYFKHSPLWGMGFGSFTDTQGMTAHNSYLLCAAELGMIGYFLWMSIVVVTMIQLGRVPVVVGITNPPLARWAVALKLSLGVYLFTSFFLSRAYDLPLFLLLGMSGAVIVEAGGDDAIPLRGTGWAAWSFSLCLFVLGIIYVLLRLRAV